MSDDILVPSTPRGEYVPIEDTICECNHWYDEHDDVGCNSCICVGFLADPEASTPEAIADRGGDPMGWPQHVKRHFLRYYPEQVPELRGS